jgi:hypothetical protein
MCGLAEETQFILQIGVQRPTADRHTQAGD